MAQGSEKKMRGLGRGLNALFEDEETQYMPAQSTAPQQAETQSPSAPPATTNRGPRQMLNVDQMVPGMFQPRQSFDDDSLATLADSIKAHGLLQPILVRKLKDDNFEIIAGERRWRAAQIAQLHEVPVIISELTDSEALEIGLVENLQREDLNPVDEAMGYMRLMNDFDRTQEEVASALGKSRSHVANMVRLLNLPPKVIDYLRDGKLTPGHARTLVTVNNAQALADEIVARNLNVRQAEALTTEKGGTLKKKLSRVQKDTDTVALENDLSNLLGMKVVIDSKNGKAGSLRVEFKSLNQLDDLIHRLSKIPVIKLAD